jgi:hypothetical protein
MPSKDEIRITTDAIRAEGGKWDGLGDEMARVKTSVDNLTLNESAFFIGDDRISRFASQAYGGLHGTMSALVGEGSIEFAEIAGAMRKMADLYEQTEGQVVVDLGQIYGD